MISSASQTQRLFSTRLMVQTAMVVVLAASAAQAQNVPASVQGSQIDRRFKAPPAPLESVGMELPLPGEPKELSKAQQDKLSKVKFTLKRVNVLGATVFSEEQMAPAYESLVGKRISLLDAQVVARKITDIYQKAGYVLSQAVVPQQEISGGTLKIQVVEGYVGSIVLQGDGISDGERARLMSYLDNVKSKRPVRTQDLERNMLLINDLPGASVKGLLRPAPSQFGAAELLVTVTQKPYEGSLSTDNRGSKFVGPWQHSATVAANSLFGMYDRTQLRLSTSSPTKELRTFEVQHDEMLGNDGTKLSLLASRTHTAPGDSLKNIQIIGNSDLFEAKVSHPFIRSRQENLVGRALVDIQRSDTDVFDNLDFTQDRLRIVRLGGSYNFFDQFHGNNLLDMQVSQGLNVFNASESGTNRTNANGESDFTKVNFDATHLHPLPNKFSLFTAASGQYSLDPLLVAEQFSLGGANFGTAYDPAELLGDHGITGKIELRYSDQVGMPYFNYYQLFSYYDIGRTWIREGGSGANDKRSLASLGGGIRVSFTDNVSSTLELGVPLTKPASNQGGHANDARVFFGTTARF